MKNVIVLFTAVLMLFSGCTVKKVDFSQPLSFKTTPQTYDKKITKAIMQEIKAQNAYNKALKNYEEANKSLIDANASLTQLYKESEELKTLPANSIAAVRSTFDEKIKNEVNNVTNKELEFNDAKLNEAEFKKALETATQNKKNIVSGFTSENINTSDDVTEKTITDNLNTVITECSDTLNYLEKKANRRSNLAYGFALSGLIAGAVVVPALTVAAASANAVWIAAFGGYAGAANIAVENLSDYGLDSAAMMNMRNSVATELKTKWKIAGDPAKSSSSRIAAIYDMRAACAAYQMGVVEINTTKSTSKSNPYLEIIELDALLKAGLIKQEQYDQIKLRILNDIHPADNES